MKRFIEILVYRKTEFVFFFLQYMLQYFFILQNVQITVSQIFLQIVKIENVRIKMMQKRMYRF